MLYEVITQLFMEENPDILEMILVELLVEFADPSPINPLGKPANSTKTIHDYICLKIIMENKNCRFDYIKY